MLNLFKKSRVESNYQIINIFLLIFFLIVLFPVVPISLIIIVLWYMIDNDKYFELPFVVPTILLGSLLGMSFVEVNVFRIFYNEFLQILGSNIKYMLQGNILMMLKEYSHYSLYSWVIIVSISFLPSGYFVYRMNKFKKLEKVGVTNFDTKIKKLDKGVKPNSSNILMTAKEPSTLIGYNQNKKAVYCEDKAKHIFVAGTTGSGKTVLLSNFIKSGVSKGYGMFIVDGKGDVGECSMLDITEKFCAEFNKPLIVINMSDPEKSAKYNPFGGASDTMCKDMLIVTVKQNSLLYGKQNSLLFLLNYRLTNISL